MTAKREYVEWSTRWMPKDLLDRMRICQVLSRQKLYEAHNDALERGLAAIEKELTRKGKASSGLLKDVLAEELEVEEE